MLLLVSIPVITLRKYRLVYAITVCGCLLAAALNLSSSKTVQAAAVQVLMTFLFFLGIGMGTLADPLHLTVIYLALLFTVPLLFADSPMMMNVSITFSVVLYYILARFTQTPEMLAANLANVIPVWLLSLCSCTYVMRLKLSGIAAQHERQYLFNEFDPDNLLNVSSDLEGIVNLVQVMMTFHSDETLLHCKRVRSYARLLCRAYNQHHESNPISRNSV